MSMLLADLIEDLKMSMHDAAKVLDDAGIDLTRCIIMAVLDFGRVRPLRTRGTLTLVADVDLYTAPADLYDVSGSTWGQLKRLATQPWENDWPGRLPVITTVRDGGVRKIQLQPAPTAAQIASLGATYPYTYIALHVVSDAAGETTIEAKDRGLLLLRAQAEICKELATRNMAKPVTMRDGVNNTPRNATPAALYQLLMADFEHIGGIA